MKPNESIKTNYKGFELSLERNQALGGWENLYYYAMREEDGWFLVDEFTEGEDSLETMLSILKATVDDYILHPKDYEDYDESNML